MDLSVVVPLYNEEDSVGPLHRAITDALDPLNLQYEILFVDDGSRDATVPNAVAIAGANPNLKVVQLRRNFGQTPAMAAGIQTAEGRVIITMDGDLQNDPTDIPHFLEKIHEGYDIVVGWRHQRQDKLLTRKIPSRIANWLIGKVTGVPIKDNGCSLKAYRAAVIQQIPLYSEMHRFIPAMTSIAGTRVTEIKVRHHARRFGESKYGLSRIYKVLLDLVAIKTVIAFASRPLLYFAILGVPAALISALLIGTSIYISLSTPAEATVVLGAVGVMFAALTVFMLASGILSELIFRTGSLDPGALHILTVRERAPSAKELLSHGPGSPAIGEKE